MTSKELNEILNKTRRTKEISFTPEQVEELAKDLETLEEIEKLYNIYNTTDTSERIIIGNIFAILEERLDNEN